MNLLSSGQTYNERALLLRMAENDQAALGALMDHYTPVVYPYLLYWTKNAHLVQEITQDIFIRVWNNRHKLPEVVNFSGYIYTIARNRAISVLNAELLREKKEAAKTRETTAAISASPAELKELSEAINAAIETLPSRRREIFKLSRQERLTYEEIAERLQISRHTVKGHMVSALVYLRDYLKAYSDIIITVIFLLLLF